MEDRTFSTLLKSQISICCWVIAHTFLAEVRFLLLSKLEVISLFESKNKYFNYQSKLT